MTAIILRLDVREDGIAQISSHGYAVSRDQMVRSHVLAVSTLMASMYEAVKNSPEGRTEQEATTLAVQMVREGIERWMEGAELSEYHSRRYEQGGAHGSGED